MKDLEKKILDNLYELREEDIEKQYIAKYGEPEESKKTDKAEKELVNFMKPFIKSNKDLQNLDEKLDNFELCTMGEMYFWYKQYYKIGFIDGISLRMQIKEERKKLLNDKVSNASDTFFYEHMYIIKDLEGECIWRSRKDYKELVHKMSAIKEQYPNVTAFLEDNKIVELSIEELKALNEYLILSDKTKDIELIETFILGLKDDSLL